MSTVDKSHICVCNHLSSKIRGKKRKAYQDPLRRLALLGNDSCCLPRTNSRCAERGNETEFRIFRRITYRAFPPSRAHNWYQCYPFSLQNSLAFRGSESYGNQCVYAPEYIQVLSFSSFLSSSSSSSSRSQSPPFLLERGSERSNKSLCFPRY